MKKKNPSRYFFRTLTLLVLVFSALYIAMESGYYDSTLRKNVELTEEKIKEFEEDIKEGKEVDIRNYLEGSYKDYSNRISKTGNSLSISTEKFMTKGLNEIFKVLGTLFS